MKCQCCLDFFWYVLPPKAFGPKFARILCFRVFPGATYLEAIYLSGFILD